MTKLVLGLILMGASTIYAKDEVFTFVELKTGMPISNATVEIYRFATDISYDNPHPDLLVATYKTDARGTAKVDPARLPQDCAVVHIAGYWTRHVQYSPVLGRLAMPVDIRGHLRIVRIEAYSKPILGNSIYDLDARREYFVSVNGLTTTNSFKTIRVEMKKSEQGGGRVR